jgi:hypothetical protein
MTPVALLLTVHDYARCAHVPNDASCPKFRVPGLFQSRMLLDDGEVIPISELRVVEPDTQPTDAPGR